MRIGLRRRRPALEWNITISAKAARPTSSTSTATTHSADSPASNRAPTRSPATMRSPRNGSTSRTTRDSHAQQRQALCPAPWHASSWRHKQLRLRQPRPACEPQHTRRTPPPLPATASPTTTPTASPGFTNSTHRRERRLHVRRSRPADGRKPLRNEQATNRMSTTITAIEVLSTGQI